MVRLYVGKTREKEGEGKEEKYSMICYWLLLKVSVRVKTSDGSWSKWSDSFSLDTVGSEGVVSSSGDHKVYQVIMTELY